MLILPGTPITKEYFESKPDIWEHDEQDERLIQAQIPDFISFRSKTDQLRDRDNLRLEYYVRVSNISNMNVDWWTIQIDNLDHEGVASFSVRTLEDANRMLITYGLRLGTNLDDIYFDPSWNLDVSMAEMILPLVKHFAKRTQGYPGRLTWKEWRKILGHIIFALEMLVDDDRQMEAHDWFIKRDNPKGWEKMYDRIVEGQRLLGEHFSDLWW